MLPATLSPDIFEGIDEEVAEEPKKSKREDKKSLYDKCGDLYIQQAPADSAISVRSLSEMNECKICQLSADDPLNWQKYNKAVAKLPEDQAVALLAKYNVTIEKEDLIKHRAHYTDDALNLLNTMLKNEYENYNTLQSQTAFILQDGEGTQYIVPNFSVLGASNSLSNSIRNYIKLKTDLQSTRKYR